MPRRWPVSSVRSASALDVEVVNVDVIVTDEDGERIVDLGRDDFVLEVDRQPVAIDYFAPPAILAGDTPALVPEVPAGEDAESIEIARANLFVFVDQSALEWRTSSRILEEVREYVLPRTGGNERIMIAAFADNLRILSPPTTEKARIEEAFADLDTLRGRGSLAGAERNRLEREVRENARPRAQIMIMIPGTSQVSPEQAEREAGQEIRDTEMLRQEIESFGEQELDRQTRSLAALRQWIGGLAAIEGRKSVLFASAGFTSQPDLFLRKSLDLTRQKMPTDRTPSTSLETSGVALINDFEEVVRAAQNARVAFYTMSPREGPVLQGSAEFASDGEIARVPPPRDPTVAEAASSLHRLATATGGGSLYLDDRLSDRLQSVSDDALAAYSLGFTTGAGAGAGDHRINVRVRRPGLTVRHRESFRRSTLGERIEAALVAAATFATTVNPLALRLELGPPAPLDKKGKESLVPVLVRIPLSFVTLLPDGARRQGRLLAQIGVQNESKQLRMGKLLPISFTVPDDELARALDSYWAYRGDVMVGRGRQRVAVVVADELSGAISTLIATIEPPAE
ncbi:MAG: VWA domain-containing protein [Thermoanaerobaculia bacterium]